MVGFYYIYIGTYFTHSSHTLPALERSERSTTPPTTGGAAAAAAAAAAPSAAVTALYAVKVFHRIHRSSHKLLLNLILVSAGSYSYVAYYLYTYPPRLSEYLASNLLPETSVHAPGGEFFGIAGAWMFFALPATVLLGIIPYSKVAMKSVNHRLNAAGESLEAKEKQGIGLQVVGEMSTWKDLDQWRKKNLIRAALAGLAGVLGGMGIAKLTI